MTHASRKTQLEIPEGVLLGHALVARLADGLGIRVFFIKGPGSVLQGLRRPRISTDVDVFVAPSTLESMLQALRDRGWRERPVDPDTKTFPVHSITVDHPEWPCCIDVHFRFPGMENLAADCFETMWSETGTLSVAGRVVRVPSKPMAILILALHALRSPQLPVCRQELEFLIEITRRRSCAIPILKLAKATGSLAAVRPFLQEVLEEGSVQDWPEPSREWCNRVSAREPGSARLLAIRQAAPLEKVHMLWRGVFPAADVLLSTNIYADMTFSGRLVQHWNRWRRFLRALPRTVRDIVKV